MKGTKYGNPVVLAMKKLSEADSKKRMAKQSIRDVERCKQLLGNYHLSASSFSFY